MFVRFFVVVFATFHYFLFVEGILTPIIPHRYLNRGNLCRNKGSTLKLQTDTVASVEIVSSDSRSSTTDNEDDSTAFSLLASLAAACILESELKRNAMRPDGSQTPSSAANWIDDRSAYKIQSALNQIELKLADQRIGLDRDEADTWLRWMKTTPAPLFVELSQEFRKAANATLESQQMFNIDRTDLLNRIGCRLILMNSGAVLKQAIETPPGSLAFGKLLYGGVKRFRLLPGTRGGSKRRTTEIAAVKPSASDNIASWIQYGGPDRKYEAIDMGAAGVLEIYLLPPSKEMTPIEAVQQDMTLSNIRWHPEKMFSFTSNGNVTDSKTTVTSFDISFAFPGADRNEAISHSFKSKVGGLNSQIEAIVRRVLDGRVIRPAEEEVSGDSNLDLTKTVMEAETLAQLGLSPVKGVLLHGPPGTGKTLLAREISQALRARAPKIIAAPELLDRWVGGSEKLVRGLFIEAEAELAACGGDVGKSALHVIVIDEIDAVFRRRSVAEDSGEATRSSVVNQILAKLDGVNSLPNVLLIGMTNRPELLDDALLRPGRLEVQIEIPLPNKEGRREILQIHFNSLRRNGKLSRPLCLAIDGVKETIHSVDEIENNNKTSHRRRFQEGMIRSVLRKSLFAVQRRRGIYDLASVTEGFSGADLAGLVRCAGSIALSRTRQDGTGVEGLLITLKDVEHALIEMKQ